MPRLPTLPAAERVVPTLPLAAGASLGKPQAEGARFLSSPCLIFSLVSFDSQKPLWENKSTVPVAGSTSWCGEVGIVVDGGEGGDQLYYI